KAILDALDQFNDRVQNTDQLIIFFAGHGSLDVGPQGDVINFLVPFDARLVAQKRPEPASVLTSTEAAPGPAVDETRVDPTTCIAIADLQEKLEKSRARELLLVLDSCFSGSTGRTLRHAPLDAAQAQGGLKDIEALKKA